MPSPIVDLRHLDEPIVPMPGTRDNSREDMGNEPKRLGPDPGRSDALRAELFVKCEGDCSGTRHPRERRVFFLASDASIPRGTTARGVPRSPLSRSSYDERLFSVSWPQDAIELNGARNERDGEGSSVDGDNIPLKIDHPIPVVRRSPIQS
jgi:hypothetical protein